MKVLKICRNDLASGRVFLLTISLFVFFFSGKHELKAQDYFELDQFVRDEGIGQEDRLYKLFLGHEHKILISNRQKSYPDSDFPQILEVDANSISELAIGDPKFRTIKLVSIRLDGESSKSKIRITPQVLKAFPTVQYILITSDVPVTESEVRTMVSGFQAGIMIVLFQVSSPV